jgi:hypothetical protein
VPAAAPALRAAGAVGAAGVTVELWLEVVAGVSASPVLLDLSDPAGGPGSARILLVGDLSQSDLSLTAAAGSIRIVLTAPLAAHRRLPGRLHVRQQPGR